MTAPILTRTHRPTGTPRRCRGCGSRRGLEDVSAHGARASWCLACRCIDGDWDRPRLMPLLVWSGAREAGVVVVVEMTTNDERIAA